jgi:hypothetical protein
LEAERIVSNDWVVRYDNRLLQLERQSGHAPARSTVVVREDMGGHLEIRYRGRVIRSTEITAAARVPVVAAPAVPPVSAMPGPRRRYHPQPDHPWRADRVRGNWEMPVP